MEGSLEELQAAPRYNHFEKRYQAWLGRPSFYREVLRQAVLGPPTRPWGQIGTAKVNGVILFDTNNFSVINYASELEAMKLSDTREYRSPVRDQAKVATREKIVDAVVRVVLDDGIHAFTVQNVADKAGVSHRTVYRHFKTREELLAGLAASLEAKAEEASFPSYPVTVDDIINGVGPFFEAMGEGEDQVRAYIITSIAMQWQDEPRRRRTQVYNRVMRAALPHLSSGEVREAGALIRSVSGSRSWYQLTFEGGLDSKAAARAADWATRVLFKELRRRDQAAAKRTNGS